MRHACISPEPQPDGGSVTGCAEPPQTQAHPVQADPDPGAPSHPCNPGKGLCCSQGTAARARSHHRPQGPSVLRGGAAQTSSTGASPLPLPAEALQEPAAQRRRCKGSPSHPTARTLKVQRVTDGSLLTKQGPNPDGGAGQQGGVRPREPSP